MIDFRDISYLYHHGIKGQKWGVRRYQNEDGSLTPEGKKRYGISENNNSNEYVKKLDKMSQDQIVDYFDTGDNVREHRDEFEKHYRKECENFLSKNSKKIKELEEKTGVKIDIHKLAPTYKEYNDGAYNFDFQDLVYDNDLNKDLNDFVFKLDGMNMTFASLYEDPHFGRDRLYHSDNSLSHHGVKGQKWGVRKEEEPKHRREINVKITPKIAIASGAAFLAAGGATLLARKISKGHTISGGYVVEKGVRGIHYAIDVGKTVTTALVAGGVGALTVTSAANIINKKKDGDK